MNFVGFAKENIVNIIIDYGTYQDAHVIYVLIQVPGSMMRNIEPFENPNIIRTLMVLPKIMAFLLIFCILLLIYPFFCFIITVKFHY